MSHFTCLVISRNETDVERQLAPFHEFECTGWDDEYVTDVDETAKVLAKRDEYLSEGKAADDALMEALEWYGYDAERIVTSRFAVDRNSGHKYGYAIVTDGQLVKAVDRTNEHAHWDWWAIGGRWSERLITKDGRHVDQARKADVDFIAMRRDAEQDAGEEYDAITAVIAGRALPDWESIRAAHPDDLATAQKVYREHPVIRDLTEAGHSFFHRSPSDYLVPRQTFITQEGRKRVTTFAVVRDQMWHQRAEMGWWGFTSNERPDDEWEQTFWQLVETAPEDALLTVVDCHV